MSDTERTIPTHVQAAADAAGAALGLTTTSIRHLAVVMNVFNQEDNTGRPGPYTLYLLSHVQSVG